MRTFGRWRIQDASDEEMPPPAVESPPAVGNPSPLAEPSITLLCVEGESCLVHLEPWGTEHVLASDDFFVVRSTALITGHVRISHHAAGMSVWFTDDSPVVVTD